MMLSNEQHDLLCELINIGVGRAANSLNALINSRVTLAVPTIEVRELSEVENSTELLTAIQMEFGGAFKGMSSLIFPAESASKLTSLLIGEEEDPIGLDTLRMGALCEIGNILLNAVVGSIGNVLLEELEYSVPDYAEGTLRSLLERGAHEVDGQMILAKMEFNVEEHRIRGSVLLYFEFGSMQAFCESLNCALAAA